jgi:hypothetical protein
VLAERWGHGPIFGAWGDAGQQINLTPAATEPGEDVRLTGVYGIRASGLLAEGVRWTDAALGLAVDWLGDVNEVLQPSKVTRMSVQIFGLYPVVDPSQASRRLRSRYYRADNLAEVLPPALREHQDRFHAAINWLVPDGDRQSSLVLGVVGPLHGGAFFTFPDAERDGQWWMGVNLIVIRSDNVAGIGDPLQGLRTLIDEAETEFEHVAGTVLREVMP